MFPELIFSSLTIIFVSIFVSFKITKNILFSLLISLVKALIFFTYFSIYGDDLILLGDDESYYNFGILLKENKISFYNFLFNLDSVFKIIRFDGAIGYYIVNLISFQLFGDSYSSPVALNILICILNSYLFTKLLLNENLLNRKNYKHFYIFFSLHPVILTWSSLINIKDLFVMFLTTLLFYSFVLFEKKRFLKSIILGFFISIILFYTRFYIPFIFLVSVFVVFLINSKKSIKSNLLLFFICVIALIYYNSAFLNAINIIKEYNYNSLLGFIRILITPLFFSPLEIYSFLFISAIFKFIAFPFLFLGVLSSFKFRKSKLFQILFIYTFLLLLILASTSILQGPRQRLQVESILIYFEFIGIIYFMKLLHSLRNTITKKI
jgi:hypothetical protein